MVVSNNDMVKAINKNLITELDLRAVPIEKSKVVQIANAIKMNTSIESLNLGTIWYEIDEVSQKAFIEALEFNTTIKHLYGMNQEIAEVLRSNKNYCSLTCYLHGLSDPVSTEESIVNFLRSVTKSLRFNNEVKFFKSINTILGKTFPYLDFLSGGTPEVIEAIKTWARTKDKVDNLLLEASKFLPERELKYLLKNYQSRNIAIARVLAGNKNIISVSLLAGIHHKLSQEEAIEFANVFKSSATIQSICLAETSLSADTIEPFVEFINVSRSIKFLNLSHNNIGDEGVQKLAKALITNKTITHINLSANNIGDIGVKAITKALMVNRTITHLNLSYNNLSNENIQAILEVIKNNSTLADINLLVKNCLVSIKEKHSQTIAHRQLDSDRNILAETISANNSIMELKLFNGLKLSKAGAKLIASSLKTNHNISSIFISANNINILGAIAFAEVLKVNKNIKSLSMPANNIGAEGATAIADSLKSNKTITYLNLSANYLLDAGAIAIAGAIKVNNSISTLYLDNNMFRTEGVIAIAEALKINKTIKVLDLSSNKASEQGTMAVAEALKINDTINHLNLSNIQAGDQGTVAIAEALKINKSLKCLSYSRNFGNMGIIALAEALKVNTTLTALDFGNTRINDDEFFALSEALKYNTTLLALDFGKVDISTAGAQALNAALKVNNTLEYLNIKFNCYKYIPKKLQFGLTGLMANRDKDSNYYNIYFNDNEKVNNISSAEDIYFRKNFI